jgi:hypothetical protein
MGFDVKTFLTLLDRFGETWYLMPILHNDVLKVANPRSWARSLDAAGALGLVLHYLGSAMLETHLQQTFALVPSTVSQYLYFARKALLNTLRSMQQVSIHWPGTISEFNYNLDLIQERHSLLEGAFGSIDGSFCLFKSLMIQWWRMLCIMDGNVQTILLMCWYSLLEVCSLLVLMTEPLTLCVQAPFLMLSSMLWGAGTIHKWLVPSMNDLRVSQIGIILLPILPSLGEHHKSAERLCAAQEWPVCPS